MRLSRFVNCCVFWAVSRSTIGCCCCCWWWWLFTCWTGMDSPDWEDCTANLKISNESGFSGVAAVMPKMFPAGRETYNGVRIINLGIV